MLKKFVFSGFAAAAMLTSLVTGPGLNFSQLPAAQAVTIIVCADGSEPTCVPFDDGHGHVGFFCYCG